MFIQLAAAILTMAAPQVAPAVAPMPQRDSATVTVQNDRKVPVNVFLAMDYGDLRVGTVPPLKTETLAMPSWLVRDGATVHLFLEPEGETDLGSRDFTLKPGAHFALLVPEEGTPEPPPMRAHMTAKLTPAEAAETTLTVENERPADVVIYVEQGDFDLRLGVVPAASSETLVIPAPLAREQDSIALFAHVMRGPDLGSEVFQLRPGAHLGMLITPSNSN